MKFRPVKVIIKQHLDNDYRFRSTDIYSMVQKLGKISLTWLALLLIVGTSTLHAQSDSIGIIEYDRNAKKVFEIGGIKVIGNDFSDEKAIIALSGLKVGDNLEIPGHKLPKAIKNLFDRKLFTDVQVRQEKIIGDIIFLEIKVQERARLSKFAFRGEKKRKHDDLVDIVNGYLTKGGIITSDVLTNAKNALTSHYTNKGYLDAEVSVKEIPENKVKNAVKLIFTIDKKERIKIKDITFSGNDNVKAKKLRKLMGGTKRQRAILSKSKLIDTDYEEDKKSIIAHYNNKGFRDARIIKDSIWRDEKGKLKILVDINEGNQYYFRNIDWKGNTLYGENRLNSILGIAKGDVYNEELLNNRLRFSLDGRDVSSLYLDDGYLFFNVDPTEVAIIGDSIDIQMRVYEGPQATIDRVEVSGNDRTHDHVIIRELRTRPGQKFSRSDIIRSQRELLNLGYFDPESMDVQTPVNQQKGTVDILYKVAERPSDQLELSAGWGGQGSGVFGTLGVVFNNFSLRNILHKEAWRPLPQGDGQKLSLRFQSNGRFWRSLNFSFTEPWLGGKKPNSFSVGGSNLRSSQTRDGNSGVLTINRIFAGLGTRLRWPDDNFVSNTTATLEQIKLKDRGGFSIDDGTIISRGSFYNLSLKQTFARSTINEPIFPKSGSRFSLSVQLTPPYSLFRKWTGGDNSQFYRLSSSEQAELIAEANEDRETPIPPEIENSLINSAEASKRFNFLEYHKWRFDAEWYSSLFGKFVLKTSMQLGMVGAYNGSIGLSPFERFELGGDGISNQTNGIEGKDVISMRGYDPEHFASNFTTSESGRPVDNGAAIFNKYTLELRYPLSTNPNSTIYLHTFLQAGNVYKRFRDYNPFNVKKSTGFGLRVFLPMFGTLGFDYGIGFDKQELIDQNAKWSDFAKFSIILGFEPE